MQKLRDLLFVIAIGIVSLQVICLVNINFALNEIHLFLKLHFKKIQYLFENKSLQKAGRLQTQSSDQANHKKISVSDLLAG